MTSLNDVVIEDIKYQPQQLEYNDSVTSFRTIHLNINPIGHSAKLPGHITLNAPQRNNDP